MAQARDASDLLRSTQPLHQQANRVIVALILADTAFVVLLILLGGPRTIHRIFGFVGVMSMFAVAVVVVAVPPLRESGCSTPPRWAISTIESSAVPPGSHTLGRAQQMLSRVGIPDGSHWVYLIAAD